MNLQEIKNLEREEFIKRDKELCFIPSEGFPTEDILQAQSSIFSLKYAEGRKNARYYAGCENIDKMVDLCEQHALTMFNAKEEYSACCEFHSGTNANLAIYGAILDKDDTVLSMSVENGAHISHGHKLSFLGKYHNVIQYGLDDKGFIDYKQVEELALRHKPKLIICGCSAYSRIIDFKKFKEIADRVCAYLMADIAHITSLVICGLHPSPVGLADFISFTTHKMLNCPRGGVVLYKKQFEKDITRGLIPFSSGGPLENMVYAKLVGFNNILNNMDKFKQYTQQIINNSKCMEKVFKENNIPIISNGTDNHLLLLDLSNYSICGRDMAKLLEECGIICNCNAIPNDKKGFFKTSGIRLGTPFVTARGLTTEYIEDVAKAMSDLINLYKDNKTPDENTLYECKLCLKMLVNSITALFPMKNIYPKIYKRLFEDEV